MAQVRDPVCGMFFESNEAAGTTEYKATHYYFCSSACQREFESNPELYADTERAAASGREWGEEGDEYMAKQQDIELEKHEPPRTTIGPITAPKFGSAGSGGAEYELLPEKHIDEDEDGGEEVEVKRRGRRKR